MYLRIDIHTQERTGALGVYPGRASGGTKNKNLLWES